MSKSKGNIIYTDTLLKQGYTFREIRFFLIYGHYRSQLDYSEERFQRSVDRLRTFQKIARSIKRHLSKSMKTDSMLSKKLQREFSKNMDNDLNVKGAFDSMYTSLSECKIEEYPPKLATGILAALKDIDKVLRVIF